MDMAMRCPSSEMSWVLTVASASSLHRRSDYTCWTAEETLRISGPSAAKPHMHMLTGPCCSSLRQMHIESSQCGSIHDCKAMSRADHRPFTDIWRLRWLPLTAVHCSRAAGKLRNLAWSYPYVVYDRQILRIGGTVAIRRCWLHFVDDTPHAP